MPWLKRPGIATNCRAGETKDDLAIDPRLTPARMKGAESVACCSRPTALPLQVLALTVALILCTGLARSADQVSVTAAREGRAVRVHAHAIVHASREVIWQTLTDYENLPRFIPGLDKSQVLRRDGNGTLVEQVGRTSFLFFTYPIHVVVRAEEDYPRMLRIRLVSGNLKQLESVYRIESVDGDQQFLLRWTAVLEADLPVPLFVAVRLVRTYAQEQFSGILGEIERREQARGRRG
jgi:ribosome-associated toxin RatA of RatAB toxin-antitoxin module